MITVARRSEAKTGELPPLENGDHLDQKTFHERYEAMPSHIRAELIGGIVYMSSPQKAPHGEHWVLFSRWMDEYLEATPGTRGFLNSSNILGPVSEPQPDGCLFIRPECGGQTWEDEDKYLNGAPEWIGELSDSTESIDLHRKKKDYEKAGVREYMVVALQSSKVFWFTHGRGKFKEMRPDPDGILRSEVFPGLWLDPAAFLQHDRQQLLAVLRQGLASPEHAAFVTKLAAKQRSTKSRG
jgi:Uma2 family endonuclease